MKRIPDGTVLRRDNHWGIPWKRALFVSDGQIARRLVVTFWRATMIGLRRKNILTYLTPDDHMMCMWQRNYVLRVDNWKKQWSGCSKTLQITARSSNSIGHRLWRSLLGTWTVCPPRLGQCAPRDVVDHCRGWESHATRFVHLLLAS